MNNKSVIRKEIIAKREKLSKEQFLEFNIKILGNLFDNLSFFDDFNSFAFYYPIKNEVDILPFAFWALESGKQIYFPKILQDNSMKFYEVKDFNKDFTVGKFGIKEPSGKNYRDDIDLYFIPSVALNKDGYRIGMGGGFYDRYFSSHNGLKLSPIYSFAQNLEFVYQDWDIKADFVVSEDGFFRVK